MIGVLVSCALILAGSIVEILVLQQQISELVVNLRRLRIGRERREELPVPALRLVEVRSTLVNQAVVLVERMIVPCEIVQVGLEERDDKRVIFGREILPVLGVQGVARSKLFLRLNDEQRETGMVLYLDHAHTKMR